MISYDPFWATLKAKNRAIYSLRRKGCRNSIGGATLQRIKAGQSISTNALDSLCKMLECSVTDLIEYRADPTPPIE